MVRAGTHNVITGQNRAGSDGFFTARERDILLRVKAKPGARADRIAGVRGESLLVEVRAAPERGKANEGIIRVLAVSLGVKASAVALKSGPASPNKVFVLPLQSRAALQRLEKELT